MLHHLEEDTNEEKLEALLDETPPSIDREE
jgi:hypothetical protein